MTFALPLLIAVAATSAGAQKFYDDDPLWREPPPLRVETLRSRKVSDYYDFFHHTLATPGEKNTPGRRIPARGVNTLGEVPDGAWYVNRHGRNRMALADLLRGPDQPLPPSVEGEWRIVGAKTQGVTPGFTIVDSRGSRYLLKFDPPFHSEMATAADVIGSRFFHALGYHVPEYYIVRFPPDRLSLDPKTTFIDRFGKKRLMTSKDVSDVMHSVARDESGNFRGAVSLFLSGRPVGERRFYGVRRDDPNDIVPHEHRRDLRGLFVFCAWLGHDDSRSINSLDMLVDEENLRYVRHYLIDFGSILGSASTKANSARSGNEHLFSWKPALKEIFTLGIWAPAWARAEFPDIPSVGRFEWERFDPEKFKPEYPNPAFLNRLPEDNFWAAKQVMRFTDEEIAAIVRTGQYSDPRAVEWLTRCLIERRNKIGRTYFNQILPLDRFEVKDGAVVFEDLALTHRLAPPRQYRFRWYGFDNQTERKTPIAGAAGARIPDLVPGGFVAAEIEAGQNPHRVTVYLRNQAGVVSVAGVERSESRTMP